MLKKEYRLPSQTFIKSSLVYKTTFFIARIASNNLDISRFGFVVSKKVDKRATARNKIKRIFRSCIEQNIERIKPGFDFLFIVKKESLSEESKNICSSVIEVLIKERLLKTL